MNWFKKIFNGGSGGARDPEEVVRFYQGLGFFASAEPADVIQRYVEEHGSAPETCGRWNDVFLLAGAEGEVWAEDPEADVCAENAVYSEVLPRWAAISNGAFEPAGVSEHWESESGPITLNFELGGKPASVSPGYQDDWLDLEVLRQLNELIAPSGRQFECAVDRNFALVLCMTPEQKRIMQSEGEFPFAW